MTQLLHYMTNDKTDIGKMYEKILLWIFSLIVYALQIVALQIKTEGFINLKSKTSGIY